MKNTTRNILIGFALAVGVLALLGAVPSQTDFDGTYFKTNTLPISLIGNLVNWQQRTTNSFSSHWVDSGTSDSTLAGSGHIAQTNFVNELVSSNGITLGGVRQTTWPAGGNVTNTGASVIGMFPTYTDTSGTQVTPTNTVPSLTVGYLSLSNMVASVVPVFDSTTNLVASRTSTNDIDTIRGIATNAWQQVTPDTTNSVINLSGAIPGIDRNFYYSLSTSNYIIFSNVVQGAQGTIWINASGTPRQVNFSSSYDNFSTNDLSGMPFSLTNRCIIAYKVGWGTDATNVMLAVKKK